MTVVPDLAEPVVAWRVWDAVRSGTGAEIVSPLRPVAWPARRTMAAVCERGCPDVPSPTCGCGLYAMADLDRLSLHSSGQGRIVGCTALWGQVLEHSHGFRAERGYPLVLFLRTGPQSAVGRMMRRRRGLPAGDGLAGVPPTWLAQDLARRYAVPVGVVPPRSVLDEVPDQQCARAVGQEAVRGLAARRAGDLAAHERLAALGRELVGGDEWYAGV